MLGVTMRLWSVEDPTATPGHKGCCSVEDVDDARRVCQILGVPHYFLNFEREFQAHVVDYFVQEYQRARTPHPCIACNDRLKFDFLLRRALALGCDYVATGHYARLAWDQETHRWGLLRGLDHLKDQSYVLFNLTQQELDHVLLPVGWYSKDHIRQLAAQAAFPVATKPDSQDICFIPSGDYRQFLRERVTPRPGDIVDTAGNVLGHHEGLEFFTVGQRRSLGIVTGEKLYVVRVDARTNRVVVGSHDDLLQDRVRVSRVNYVGGQQPRGPVEVTAKIRYKAAETPAILEPHNDHAVLHFHQPQRAITPGQAAVFYQGDQVLGGGFIDDFDILDGIEQKAISVPTGGNP